MPVKTIHSSQGLLMGEVGSMVVLVPTRSPDNQTFNFIYDTVEAFAQRFAKITYLIILTSFDGQIKADLETQKKRAAGLAKWNHKFVGTAIVITVPGLKGTMIRMIATAATIFIGGTGPTKIFAKVAEAVDWVKSQPGQSADLSTDPFLAKYLEDFVTLLQK
jgi:hypothetical protein